MRRLVAAALLCAISCGGTLAAQTPAEDEFELGIRLCDEGRMVEALPIYQRITKSHPFYAMGWLGLGWSLHYTGRTAEAIPAYQKAIDLGASSPHQATLEIARCHLLLGHRAEALQWVERALEARLPSINILRRDKRLEGLRSDPTYRRLAGIVEADRMTRAEGWRYDLALLEREIRRVHYAPFRSMTSAELTATIRWLERSVARSTDDQMAVEIMRLMRRLGDGHTFAEPEWQERKIAPVLVGLFDDGLFVTAVAPGFEDLLWARVVAVEGRTVEQAMAAVGEVVGQDNTQRPKSVGPELLRDPRLMVAMGLGRDPNAVAWRVVDRTGRERDVRLEARESEKTEWVRRPPDTAVALPLLLRDRKTLYWLEPLPESRALYFQYNGVREMESESVEAFAGRLEHAIEADGIDRLVVDLRWNGGGNVFTSRPILAAILRSKVNRPGKLFVIAGRHTFSAAMIFAEQLERYSAAIFVGEPTGSSPNFVGETNYLDLPYSKVRVSISNLYWQTSHATDRRTWIPPRVSVPPTFTPFMTGRDPALEAALKY